MKTSQHGTAKHQKHADKAEFRDCKYCGKSHKRGSNFCSVYGKRCSKCNNLHHFASVFQSRKGRKQPYHISISPCHSHLNGKVESAVAIVKTLMNKAEGQIPTYTKPYWNGETLLPSTCYQVQFKTSFQEEPKLFCQGQIPTYTKPYWNGETLLPSTGHHAQFKNSFQEEPKLFWQLIPSCLNLKFNLM